MLLTEFEKNELLTLIQSYVKTKEASLLPIFNEIIQSLELGNIDDAYQARYIRDAISSSEINIEKFKDINEKIIEEFFNN